MITKIGKDLYHLNSLDGTVNMELSFADMKERLVGCGVWTEEQVDALKHFEIGDETPPVRAYYYLSDGVYHSDKGAIGKKVQ